MKLCSPVGVAPETVRAYPRPMTDEGAPVDKAGTLRDWPVGVIAVALLLAFFAWGSGGRPIALVWLLLAFGFVALLIRRGAFTPRR